MHCCTAETGADHPDRFPEEPALASVASRPIDPLTLPRASAIQHRYRAHAAPEPKFARLAGHLYDRGLLSEQDTDIGSIAQLVEVGMSRWFNNVAGDLQWVNRLGATIATAREDAMGYVGCGEESEDPVVYLMIESFDSEAVLCVGEVLMRLETILPGLGQTIYAVIEHAGYRTVVPWNPAWAQSVGARLYWYGTETDEDFLEETASFDQNRADEEDIYRPSQFLESFGAKWVFNAREVIPERRLKKLARRHPLEWVRRLCSIALAAGEMIRREVRIETDQDLVGMEPVYGSVILRWDEEDDMLRVNDDYIQYANECADVYTPIVAAMEIPLEEEAFAVWEKKARSGFCLFRLLNEALGVIAEQNQEMKDDRSTDGDFGEVDRAHERDCAV